VQPKNTYKMPTCSRLETREQLYPGTNKFWTSK
jgi:hypothetical protein